MKKYLIIWVILALGLAMLMESLWGGEKHSTATFFRDVSEGTYSEIDGLTATVTNGGTYTNGTFTNFYRLNATNILGRLPTSLIVSVTFTGSTNLSNAVFLTWARKDGIEAYIVEFGTNVTTFTNWTPVTFTLSLTNFTDLGTNIPGTNVITTVYAQIPQATFPWVGGSSTQALQDQIDANRDTNSTQQGEIDGKVDTNHTGNVEINGDLTLTNGVFIIHNTNSGNVLFDSKLFSIFDGGSASRTSINWNARILIGTDNRSSVDWDKEELLSGISVAVDWADRELRMSTGQATVEWQERILRDLSGILSVTWQSRQLIDSGNQNSIDWENGTLKSNNIVTVDYRQRRLMDPGGSIEVLVWDSSQIRFTNVVIFVGSNMTVQGILSNLSDLVMNGNILFALSNAFDIASAANPVRTGYFGTVSISTNNTLLIGTNRVTVSADGKLRVNEAAIATEAFASSAAFIGFSVHRNGTDQTGIASGAFNSIDWTTEVYDDGGGFNLATDEFIPPSNGKYQFTFSQQILDVAANKVAGPRLLTNGVVVAFQNDMRSVSGDVVDDVTVDLDLTTNHIVEASAVHFHGSDRTLSGDTTTTYFMGSRIGD